MKPDDAQSAWERGEAALTELTAAFASGEWDSVCGGCNAEAVFEHSPAYPGLIQLQVVHERSCPLMAHTAFR